MEVKFQKPVKLGNRAYGAGKQEIPDSLAHNLSFKHLVKSGVAHIIPRDQARQKIQSAHDLKAHQRAQHAAKAHRSAPGTPSAKSHLSSVSEPAQALPTPAQPIKADATALASELVASATAQGD